MQMKVVYNGEEHLFDEAKLGDLVAFERYFGLKANVLQPKPVLDENGAPVINDKGEEVLEADVALEWLAFLIWRSMRRNGVISKDTPFDDDFLDGIDSLEQIETEGDEDADPTGPDQPHG